MEYEAAKEAVEGGADDLLPCAEPFLGAMEVVIGSDVESSDDDDSTLLEGARMLAADQKLADALAAVAQAATGQQLFQQGVQHSPSPAAHPAKAAVA